MIYGNLIGKQCRPTDPWRVTEAQDQVLLHTYKTKAEKRQQNVLRISDTKR